MLAGGTTSAIIAVAAGVVSQHQNVRKVLHINVILWNLHIRVVLWKLHIGMVVCSLQNRIIRIIP